MNRAKINPSNLAVLSIIIPTLNEEDNLPILFQRIDSCLNKANINYEIILVDDHSNDSTLTVSKNFESVYDVKTFTKRGKVGKAYSLLEGFALASSNIVCMIDGDLQYPPEEIVNMYKLMMQSKVDIVITERIDMRNSYKRKISTKVFNSIFAKGMFGIDYDTQSGLKLFNKHVLDEIILSPSPWSFDLEFIVRSLEAGFSIASHKIPFYERTYGQPKLKVLKATYELSVASIKLRKAISLPLIKHAYKKNVQYAQSLIVSIIIISSGMVIGSFSKPSDAAALSLNYSPNSQSQNLSNIENQINNLSYNEPATTTNNNNGSTNSSTSKASSSSNSIATSPAKSAQASKSVSSASQASNLNYEHYSTAAQTASPTSNPYNPIETKASTNGLYQKAVYKNNKLSYKQTHLLDTISEILVGVAVLMFVLASQAKNFYLMFKKSKSYKLFS
jgi:glycosyltransferase involved in cell wall biosynthesis